MAVGEKVKPAAKKVGRRAAAEAPAPVTPKLLPTAAGSAGEDDFIGEPASDVAAQLKAFYQEVNADDAGGAVRPLPKTVEPTLVTEDLWDLEEPPTKKQKTAQPVQDEAWVDEWSWGEWQDWDSRKRKRDEHPGAEQVSGSMASGSKGFMACAPLKLSKKEKKRAKKAKKSKRKRSTSSTSGDSSTTEPKAAGAVFREAPAKPKDLSPEELLDWSRKHPGEIATSMIRRMQESVAKESSWAMMEA